MLNRRKNRQDLPQIAEVVQERIMLSATTDAPAHEAREAISETLNTEKTKPASRATEEKGGESENAVSMEFREGKIESTLHMQAEQEGEKALLVVNFHNSKDFAIRIVGEQGEVSKNRLQTADGETTITLPVTKGEYGLIVLDEHGFKVESFKMKIDEKGIKIEKEEEPDEPEEKEEEREEEKEKPEPPEKEEGEEEESDEAEKERIKKEQEEEERKKQEEEKEERKKQKEEGEKEKAEVEELSKFEGALEEGGIKKLPDEYFEQLGQERRVPEKKEVPWYRNPRFMIYPSQSEQKMESDKHAPLHKNSVSPAPEKNQKLVPDAIQHDDVFVPAGAASLGAANAVHAWMPDSEQTLPTLEKNPDAVQSLPKSVRRRIRQLFGLGSHES